MLDQRSKMGLCLRCQSSTFCSVLLAARSSPISSILERSVIIGVKYSHVFCACYKSTKYLILTPGLCSSLIALGSTVALQWSYRMNLNAWQSKIVDALTETDSIVKHLSAYPRRTRGSPVRPLRQWQNKPRLNEAQGFSHGPTLTSPEAHFQILAATQCLSFSYTYREFITRTHI